MDSQSPSPTTSTNPSMSINNSNYNSVDQARRRQGDEGRGIGPQESYQNAINYPSADVASAATTNMPYNIKNMLQNVNDNKYLYPTVSIIVVLVMVLIVLFQKSISTMVKVLFFILLAMFIVYTVYRFKYSTTIEPISSGMQAPMRDMRFAS